MSYEMPPELKSKVTDLGLEAARRPHTARRPWMVVGLTAGIAALALGAYFMAPKPAVAKTWAMVRQAVDQITSFQMIVSTDNKAEGEKHVRIAAANGRMRIDSGEGEIVYIGADSIQVYNEKDNKVVRIKLGGPEFLHGVADMMGDIASHMDLKGEIARFEKEYGKENIKIGPIYQKDGRGVYDVEMRDPKNSGRAFLTVDAQTDLPIFIRATDTDNHEGTAEIVLRYNDRIEIEPNFPKGVKYEDIDLGNMQKLGADMEKLGKSFGKEMERKGKEFGEAMERMGHSFEKSFGK